MKKIAFTLLFTFLFFAVPSFAGDSASSAQTQVSSSKIYRIGVVLLPPFASYQDGKYRGFVVALWKSIAARENIHYQFYNAGERSAGAIGKLEKGQYDALLGPISVTSDRLQQVQYSRPFYVNRLGIVSLHSTDSFWHVFWKMIKVFFAWSLLVYFLLLLLYSILHLVLERLAGAENFQGNIVRAFCFSLWDSTYALVKGSYHHSLQSVFSKILIIFWSVVALVFLSEITAILTSSVTISRSTLRARDQQKIQTIYAMPVSVVKDSYTSDVASRLGASPVSVAGFDQAFQLLFEKKVKAVMGSYLALDYYTKTHPKLSLKAAPLFIGSNEMAFAFSPVNNALMKKVNKGLTALQDENLTFGICRGYLSAENSEQCVI